MGEGDREGGVSWKVKLGVTLPPVFNDSNVDWRSRAGLVNGGIGHC